jgi:hypothetical protein
MSESQYRFAEFQLDCASFELRRQGRAQKSERISLERMPMELLTLLLERQGSIVTRQQIIDRLWGKDVFVDTKHGIVIALLDVEGPLEAHRQTRERHQEVPLCPSCLTNLESLRRFSLVTSSKISPLPIAPAPCSSQG